MKRFSSNRSKIPLDQKVIKQQFTFVKTIAPTASTTVQAQSLSSTDLASASGDLSNFLDMFRYFRIRRARFELITDVAITVETVFLLTFVPEGTTAPPTISSVENNHTSEMGLSGGGGNGAHCKIHLNLPDEALRSVTGGKWLVTSGDATDTFLETYGAVQLLCTASNSESFTLLVRLNCEFREIVDPLTISARLKDKGLHIEHQTESTDSDGFKTPLSKKEKRRIIILREDDD